jgi:hypothetical protein
MGIARFTVAVVAIALVAGIGLGIGRATGKHAAEPLQQGSMERGGDASDIRFYTCSMHPQIKLPGFGPCPICFMDLIPVRAGDAESAGDAISLSARAQRLARVETAEVQPRELTHELPLVGKVAPDETRITYISSYIPGRLEKLFVNSCSSRNVSTCSRSKTPAVPPVRRRHQEPRRLRPDRRCSTPPAHAWSCGEFPGTRSRSWSVVEFPLTACALTLRKRAG